LQLQGGKGGQGSPGGMELSLRRPPLRGGACVCRCLRDDSRICGKTAFHGNRCWIPKTKRGPHGRDSPPGLLIGGGVQVAADAGKTGRISCVEARLYGRAFRAPDCLYCHICSSVQSRQRASTCATPLSVVSPHSDRLGPGPRFLFVAMYQRRTPVTRQPITRGIGPA